MPWSLSDPTKTSGTCSMNMTGKRAGELRSFEPSCTPPNRLLRTETAPPPKHRSWSSVMWMLSTALSVRVTQDACPSTPPVLPSTFPPRAPPRDHPCPQIAPRLSPAPKNLFLWWAVTEATGWLLCLGCLGCIALPPFVALTAAAATTTTPSTTLVITTPTRTTTTLHTKISGSTTVRTPLASKVGGCRNLTREGGGEGKG